jgi:hypothetical protein
VVSARVNLLTKTEDFANAAWSKSGVTVTADATTAPNGTLTADLVYPTTTGVGRSVFQTLNSGNKQSIRAKAAGFSHIWFIDKSGGNGAAWFNLTTGIKGTVAAGFTSTIEPLGDGWYQCTVEAATGVFTYGQIGLSDSDNSLTATASGTNGVFFWGADARFANQGVGLPAYQRVNTSTDYDSAGFPVYIKPNGSNQFMVTNSINFTATDKMTVLTGVRKNSAATGQTVELSVAVSVNNGSFSMPANPGTGNWLFASTGTGTPATAESATNSYIAPITTVNTGIADIAGDVVTLRVNGVQAATSSADQGTGNYGNYPAYFYSRAGTSLFFNGHDYGSIARGAASTAAQITAGETYINSLTKAF